MPRNLATAAALLLITAWPASHRWGYLVDVQDWSLSACRGEVMFWLSPGATTQKNTAAIVPPTSLITSAEIPAEMGGQPFAFRFAGLAFGRFDSRSVRDTVVAVPLWLPALLSAWLAAMAWRRHWRRRRGSDHGFPITPTDAAPSR